MAELRNSFNEWKFRVAAVCSAGRLYFPPKGTAVIDISRYNSSKYVFLKLTGNHEPIKVMGVDYIEMKTEKGMMCSADL